MTIADATTAALPSSETAPLYRATGVTRTYAQKGRTVKALAGVDVEIGAGSSSPSKAPPEEASRRSCSCSGHWIAPRPGRSPSGAPSSRRLRPRS